MGQYRNILVVADHEHQGSPALQRAGMLARASGATLHLRAFCDHAGIRAVGLANQEIADLARKELLRERRDWLEREADTLRAGDLQVRVNVVWGHPLPAAIAAEVLALAPDLVLKDVETLPTLKRLLFAPLDWHLLRTCPAPLLMVNRHASLMPRRVIAAVDAALAGDPSGELNEDIVKAAHDLALQCNARLELMHAFEGVPMSPQAPLDAAATAATDAYYEFRNGQLANFEAFADRFGVPAERRHFADGLADLAIASTATDTAADVVVLGSVTRSGLSRILMGSTAERLLGGLACDVLVLKPHSFAEDLRRYFSHPAGPR